MTAPHRAPGFFTTPLSERDPALWAAIGAELGRQRDEIELIASENIASLAVMQAQGSVMTNKYAEGYPGKRYYGGCDYVDVAEQLAIERAKQLFGADYANVQPHAGSQANAAVFQALLTPGDTVLGMSLAGYTQPLERKRSVSFQALLEHVAMGGTDPEMLSSLASRLTRLDKQCGEPEHARIREMSGGVGLGEVTQALIHALDPDAQAARTSSARADSASRSWS